MGKQCKRRKIVMIGPVYPYKTGLSYYVSLLYNQLHNNNEVFLISYTMQYPKFLYRKPQKDYEDDVLKLDDVNYMLHTANPFNWLKVAKYIKKICPDLLILQWMHPYFAPCYYMLAKLVKKIKILYICHNVFPHERFPADKWLTAIALKQADFYITHSNSDAEDLKSIIRNPKMAITVHPAYNFFRRENMSKQKARERLKLSETDKVVLFFGLVREYKGLKHLLNAMAILKEKLQIKLLIAGDFAGNREVYDGLIKKNAIEENVIITDQHIPISEVEKFFAACDLVVLPYESATQSGVIQVAYSFEKPVLATRVGGLPDVVFDGETGYVVEPQNAGKIAEAVIDFYENNRSDEFVKGIEREKYRYSWERMEKEIDNLTGDEKDGL